VAVWGCGPVGQFAIASSWLLGAERVIAIGKVPERLQMAQQKNRAEVIDFSKETVPDRLREMTHGRGPDVCIDAVVLEADGSLYDQVKSKAMLESGRAHALRECIWACRKGGTVSVVGVYASILDRIPFGEAFSKDLTFRLGQCNVHNCTGRLLGMIEEGRID